MNTEQKREAFERLGLYVGLQRHGRSWHVGRIETSDGRRTKFSPECADTIDGAIEAAWTQYVDRLPADEHLVVEFFGRTWRSRWDPIALDWRDLPLTYPSTPAT